MDDEEISVVKSSVDSLGENASADTFSPPAKRVVVTYGRRRDMDAAGDPDTSSSSFSLSSRLSLDGGFSADTSANTSLEISVAEEEDDGTSPYRYSWRDKLDEVDKAYDAAESESLSGFDASLNLSGKLSLPFEFQAGSPPGAKPETPARKGVAADTSILPPRQSLFLPDSDGENSASPLFKKRGPRRRALTLGTPSPCSNSPQREPKASSLPSSPSQLSNTKSQRNRGATSRQLSPDILPTARAKGKKKGRSLDVRPLEFNESGKVRESQRKEIQTKPTKKELREIELGRAREKAEREVHVKRTETKKYTLEGFFSLLSSFEQPVPVSSDPIMPVSSPRNDTDHGREIEAKQAPPPLVHVLDDDGEDEDMPPIEALNKEAMARQKAQKLAEMKKQIVAEQRLRATRDDGDDDELVIVSARPEAKDQKRKKLDFVKIGGATRGKGPGGHVGAFKPRVGAAVNGKTQGTCTSLAALNLEMRKKVEEINRKEILKKEEEWTKRGGKLKVPAQGTGMEDAVKIYAEKGKQTVGGDLPEHCGESDQSDEEWLPQDQDASDAEGSPHLAQNQSNNDGDVSGTETLGTDDESGDKENFPRPVVRAHRRPAAYSDDEESGFPPVTPPSGRILVPDTSMVIPYHPRKPSPQRTLSHCTSRSSFEGDSDGEKENEKARMWDKSEDKENTAVVRHVALLRSGPGVAINFSQSLQSLGSNSGSLGGDHGQSGWEQGIRQPFQDLLKYDDDPFSTPASGTSSTQLPTPSQSEMTLGASGSRLPPSSPSLAPLLNSEARDDDLSDFGDKVPLASGFGALFEEQTQRPLSFGLESMSQRSSSSPMLRHAPEHNAQDLPLTLDFGLAPALEVSESKRRQADSIFEKEQQYIVEGFESERKKSRVREPEIYVNDHGFLTQTRPDVASPDIYNIPSIQPLFSSRIGLDPSQPRIPLQTLSLTTTEDSPEFSQRISLKRLKKRDMTERDEFSDGIQSSLEPLNFLKFAAQKATERKGERRKLDVSEFIEEEAVLSDEDEMHGFGGFGKAHDKDEEDDGVDLDQTLKELVDDKDMNEEELATAKVFEKHQEHLAEDDKALEKLHQDAIEGKFRIKRKHGDVGLNDDSDEDDDDDRARSIRLSMLKKQKIDDATLEALGKNDETRAFYDTYCQSLGDDNNHEFDHLQDGGADLPSEEEEEEKEVVFAHEVQRLVREAAQEQREDEVIDRHDVSWIDNELYGMEEGQQVRVRDTSVVSDPRRTNQGEIEFDGDYFKRTVYEESHEQRLQAWAKTEKKNFVPGPGRSTAGSAVTGHAKKVHAGEGSLRPGAVEPVASKPRLKSKMPSLLLKVSDRRDRFA